MKKFYEAQRRNQRGIALIVIVVMLAILAQVSTMEMIMVTTTQIADEEMRLALGNAENVAIATTSPIKEAIADEINRRLQVELDKHLEKYMTAKMALPPGSPGSFVDELGRFNGFERVDNPFGGGGGGGNGGGIGGGRGPFLPGDEVIGDVSGGGIGVGGGLGGFGGGLGGGRPRGGNGGGSIGGGGNNLPPAPNTFMCQGAVDAKLDLTEQMAICDPVNLLKALLKDSPLTVNQSIDFLTPIKPKDPRLLDTYEWKALEKQNFNQFSYKLKSAFVGQEVLQQADAGNPPSTPPKPRVEMYRYLVRANIDTLSYFNVRYELIVNFDVALLVKTFGRYAPADAGCPPAGIEAPGKRRPQPYVIDCTEIVNGEPKCVPKLVRSAEYDRICGGNIGVNFGGPCENPKGNCDPNSVPGQFSVNCDVFGDGKYFVDVREPQARVSPGCASKGSVSTSDGTLVPAYYTWQTTVRIVGVGTPYD